MALVDRIWRNGVTDGYTHTKLVKTLPTLSANTDANQTFRQQQVDAIVYQVAQRCMSKSEEKK